MQRVARFPNQTRRPGIAVNDGEIIVLATCVEAHTEPETIGQRELVVDRVARVYRVVLLKEVALEDRATVRGNGKADVAWASFDPALKPAPQMPRFERLTALKPKIVEEHQEPPLAATQRDEQRGQAGKRIGCGLNQRQRAGAFGLRGGDCGAQQRRLAHTPRAP